jgi:DNA-binding response OmpR family regulator
MTDKAQKTVLIVENQPNYTQLLVKQLLFAGLKPVVAITGEGGIKKVAECRPDLILMEAELSDMGHHGVHLSVRPEAGSRRCPCCCDECVSTSEIQMSQGRM